MTKRMLIDDTQPEETRVVVVNGNKIEDVEFESSFRKQIKGNVYLAKVMRIEPSLQAAFVDYGGNRHGFLAFGEIHPDYYHVSDEVLAEYEKEVDTIIENKKQFIREREAERARIREEKALKRAQRLEEEARLAAEIEAARLADEQNTENEPAEESNITEENAPVAENIETTVETTEATAEITETPAEASSEAITTEEKPRRRRGRKPRAVKEAEKTDIVENTENTIIAENETTAETAVETEISVTVETEAQTEEEKKPTRGRRRRVKTMAEDTGTEEEKISEEVSAECEDKEEPENITPNSSNDDDIAVDDDDDGEYDYESQRKLILMRKLFHNSKIQDVIKEGQILLVQVVKEERGNKGAALTTYLSLAGRYCVLMPNRIKSGGVSRKITNAQDRKRLKSIIKELPMSKDMSLIVRTAGEEKTKADITRDYNYLIRTWNQIRHDSLKNPAPILVYEEANLIKRALRDMFTKEISEIIVDGDAAYKTARNFMRILSPHNMKKLKSCKANDVPLFQRFQVESQLDKLHDPNVPLESGGYLVINPTEALVSIDVNSGRATKESDLEETALRTNLEAADEIAKQLRMRNLAGLIVIDFIDMDDPKNNLAIEKRMKEAMKGDRSRVQISKMSCFGLLEISRQRMHSSFLESNYQTCPFCHGRGIIRTVESGAMSILRIIEEEGTKNRSSMMNVFVPTDYAVYLLNQKRQALYEIEQRYKMAVIISADNSIKNINEYRVERTKAVKIEEPSKPTAVQPYEVEDDYDETADIQNEENESENDNNERQYRRRERNGRRYRFDRRRGRRERNNEENSEAIAEVREETPKAEETEEKTEKRKVSWWKKLING
ncbi:MAG: Rne/Rng family ribonuclease [Alphaproteobacteria bacterium]|nr:Rne/Rng family ribonuclease [Alphaproteobacteria bacterium]